MSLCFLGMPALISMSFFRCQSFPDISRRADWFPCPSFPFHSPCTPLVFMSVPFMSLSVPLCFPFISPCFPVRSASYFLPSFPCTSLHFPFASHYFPQKNTVFPAFSQRRRQKTQSFSRCSATGGRKPKPAKSRQGDSSLVSFVRYPARLRNVGGFGPPGRTFIEHVREHLPQHH